TKDGKSHLTGMAVAVGAQPELIWVGEHLAEQDGARTPARQPDQLPDQQKRLPVDEHPLLLPCMLWAKQTGEPPGPPPPPHPLPSHHPTAPPRPAAPGAPHPPKLTL